MRVELMYSPGCNSYQKALNVLETAIAEEQLPLPVELVEKISMQDPTASNTIKINGREIDDLTFQAQGQYCRLYSTQKGISAAPCLEELRNALFNAWQELTAVPWLRT